MFYECKHLGLPDYLKIEKGTNFSFPPHLHQFLCNTPPFMENTSFPIVQCAYDSGFTSLRSFNRSFKEHLKITLHNTEEITAE